jgi:TRAP-type uncharacterized transport system substrate-binding protein
VIGVVLLVSLVVIKPSAPKSIILFTSPEGSSYHEMGKRLAASLDGMGLEAEVRITTGGIDNAKQLTIGAANTVALAPSNIERLLDPDVEIDDLVSLGSIAFEPFWLFSRSQFEVVHLADLAGLRVVTGATDTVTHHMAEILLKSNSIVEQVEVVSLVDQTPEGAAVALVDGRVDAIFANGTPASPIIMGMLKQLESVEKAHAAGADPKELLAQLDELDRKTAGMFVPRSMVHDYIDDRQFLHEMRDRVAACESNTHPEQTKI